MKRKEKGSESVRFIGFVVPERKNLLKNNLKPSKFLGASLCFISLPVLKRGKAGLGLEVLAQQAAASEFQFRGNLSNTLAPVYESYLDFGNDRLVNEFLCCMENSLSCDPLRRS